MAIHSSVLAWEIPWAEESSSVLAWEIPWAEESSGLHPWDPKKSDTTERAHTHTVYVYHSQFDGDIYKIQFRLC